jgi:hypothetical protein
LLLVVDKTADDLESVVGEECHIVSAAPTGPRHDPAFPSDQFDALDNLVLLCATHHKMVDDQRETYTAKIVHSIKINHERWVETRLRSDPNPQVRVRRFQKNIPTHLPRICSATTLLGLASGSSGHYFGHEDDLSEEEIELVGEFIQEVTDWVDIGADLEPSERVRASMRIQKLINNLEQGGFYVFAGSERQQLEGGTGAPLAWPVLHLTVLRSTNPSVRNFTASAS